jgi:RHS repeat-associated protein
MTVHRGMKVRAQISTRRRRRSWIADISVVAVTVLGLPNSVSPIAAAAATAKSSGERASALATAGDGTAGGLERDATNAGTEASLDSRLDKFASLVKQASAKDSAAISSPPAVGSEILSRATAYTSTYQGSSGTLWAEYSQVPVNYQDASGAWHAIDTTLHPDPSVPGGLESGANSWQVHFGPLGTGGGMTLGSGGQSVTFVPQGANAVIPEVDPTDPSRVIYKGAWNGADLEYTVTSTGVQEDIVIGSQSAPATYSFATPGTSLGASGASLAGQSSGLPSQWSFVAPSVKDSQGNYYADAGQGLSARAGGAQVTLSPSWLAAQPQSEFPIDVDPSLTFGGVPPWNWNGTNGAVFCENSSGYTGHPSGGPYTTCTLPSGYMGAKVGWDGTSDWETELAFDVPSASTLSEPSGCTTSTVGTTSQSAYCPIVIWAQVGLGTGPTGQYNQNPGYIDVFGGRANWAYPSAGPYVLAYSQSANGPGTANGANNNTVTERAWSEQARSYFPCGSSSATPTTLGDLYQQAICGTTVPYLTIGATANTGVAGTSSSLNGALGCTTSGSSKGSGCGPYQTFQYMDLWVNYAYAPLVPTPVSDNLTASGDDVVLVVSPNETTDPDGDPLEYNFIMAGTDGTQVDSGWTSSTSWEFPVSPGVTYTWETMAEDPPNVPYSVILPTQPPSSFSGPGGSGQTAPVIVTPAGGAIGLEDLGGWDPSGNCPCATPTTNGPYAISPGDGDLVETSQDLSVPGAGMALGLTRSYDSGLAYTQASNGTAPGPLGYGWSYNLGMTLNYNSSTQVATVDQENGSEIGFSPYAAGSSPSWCLASFNYCANDARVLATLQHNSNGSWTFVRGTSGQTTFNFSSTGSLTSESDAAGDSLSSAAEASGTGACPASASACTLWTNSRSGRSLTLGFDSAGQLVSATDATSANGTNSANAVSYCYFGQTCAGGASGGGTQDLYSAVLPGAATTTYGYYTSSSNAYYRHFILTENVPSGGTVTNVYNSNGQVSSQSAPSGSVSLSYSGAPQTYQQPGTTGVPAGSTVVSTTPAGGTTEEVDYQYSSGALVAETTGYGTSQAATQYLDLNPDVLVPTTVQTSPAAGETTAEETTGTLSSAGPLSAADVTVSTDAMGNTTEEQYNAYNQVWCKVAPAEFLAGVRCPASIIPLGSLVTGAGSTLAVSPQQAGDLLVLTVGASKAVTVSSVSGGGIGTWSLVKRLDDTTGGYDAEMWSGVVSTVGASSITVTMSGSASVDLTAQELSAWAGATWSVGASAAASHDDLASWPYPSLSASGSGQVYYGLAYRGGSGTLSAGVTSGFTYNPSGLPGSDLVVDDTAATGTLAPAGADSSASDYVETVGALFSASGGSGALLPASPPAPGAADTWAGASINFYNSSDQLTASTDALGRTTAHSYTSGVSGVPNGLQYCSVAPVAYAASVACPAYGAAHVTGTTTSTFDSAGDVLTQTNADGYTTTFAYTDSSHPGLPTVTTDPDGQVTTVLYDAAGQVVSSTVSFGSYSATTLSAYNSAGQLYCTVSPAEVAAGVTCPSSPPSQSSPPPNVTSDFYNSAGQLVQTTGPTGGTSVYAYDADANQYCSVGPQAYSQGVRCPSSPPSSPPTPTNDPYLGATIATYNAEGQVSQVTNPLGGITLSAYDGDGNLSLQTVESSNSQQAPAVTTTYGYNADNQQVTKVVGYGSSQPATTVSFYDPDGNVYCSVSANAYAESGTVPYSCPAWQASWAAAAPSVGWLYSTATGAAPASAATTSFYDADGELLQQSNPDQAATISVYNANGNVVCAEDPSDMAATLAAHPSSSYPYSCPPGPLSSPPVTGSDPGYETTIYDPAGQVLSTTDAAGDTTAETYGPDGLVLTETGPGGQVTSNCYYWESASCAAAAPAGGGANALYSTTSPPAASAPAGATTTYTYLPGGATLTKTTAAGTATYAYDAAGDLRSVTYGPSAAGYAAAPNVSYTYFSSGLRQTMTDGTGTTTYTYDDASDLLSAAFSPAPGSGLTAGTTSYTYYTSGQQQNLTYPVAPAGGGSATVTDTYNGAGQLSSVKDWAGNTISFTDDPDGNLTGTAYPDSTEVSVSYDLGDAETAVDAATGTPSSPGTNLLGATYNLNSAEQVTGETDSGAISATKGYSYDNADRLGTVTLGGGSPATESYDPSGDPTTLANGATQTFNSAGQVLTAKQTSGTTQDYGYNPTGDRASSVAASSASATYPAITSVGSLASYNAYLGASSLSLPVSPQRAGDVMVIGVINDTWGTTVSSVSGGGVAAWAPTGVDYDGGDGQMLQIFYGVVSSPGSSSITVTWSSSIGNAHVAAEEFSAGTGVTWSVDSAASSASPFPSLSPARSGELYFGAAFAWGNAAAGSTPGVTYTVVPNEGGSNAGCSMVAWDTDVTGAISPTGTGAGSVAVLLTATLPAPSPITAVGPTGDHTGPATSVPVSPQAKGDVLVLSIQAGSSSDPQPNITAMSGGGVASWSKAAQWAPTPQTDADLEIWWGVVTSPGSSTVSVSWTSVPQGDEVLSQEFSAGAGATWSLDKAGDGSSSSSTITYPSLSPSGVSELYVGTALPNGPAGAGTTPGFIYNTPYWGQLCYDTNVSSAVSPTAPAPWGSDAMAALFVASNYTYNQADQLTEAGTTSGPVTYAYNGDGLLSGRTTATGTATLTWGSTSGLPLLLSDGTNDYLYGPDGTAIEQVNVATGAPQYFVSDDQGSTRALINGSGNVDATFSFDPYGNLTASSGTATTPLLYDGQYEDGATGFYYLRARWYDPGTGEFTSVDPDVAETGEPYVYAGDDPVNSGDPTGLFFNTPGGGPQCPPAGDPGNTLGRAREAYDYFTASGMTPIEASALIGNLMVESGDNNGDTNDYLNPDTVQLGPCAPNCGRGIAMWNPSRYTQMQNLFGVPATSVPSFSDQLQFIVVELGEFSFSANGTMGYTYNALYWASQGTAPRPAPSNLCATYGKYNDQCTLLFDATEAFLVEYEKAQGEVDTPAGQENTIGTLDGVPWDQSVAWLSLTGEGGIGVGRFQYAQEALDEFGGGHFGTSLP